MINYTSNVLLCQRVCSVNQSTVSSMHWENSQVFLGGSHDNTTHAQAAHFLFAATNYYERLLNNVLRNI